MFTIATMQFSNHGRKRVASVDDVATTVTRRVEGIRDLLNSHPTEESLRQYRHDALTLSVNVELLRSVLYPYQRTLILVMSLCPGIEQRNVAGRNSDGSRSNENNNSTLNTTNVLPNSVTDNISITITTTSGISPIREENER